MALRRRRGLRASLVGLSLSSRVERGVIGASAAGRWADGPLCLNHDVTGGQYTLYCSLRSQDEAALICPRRHDEAALRPQHDATKNYSEIRLLVMFGSLV